MGRVGVIVSGGILEVRGDEGMGCDLLKVDREKWTEIVFGA